MYRVSAFLRHFALALAAGIAVATLWVNLAPASYYDAIEWRLADLALPLWMAAFPIALTPVAIVSEGLMALFLFYIGKELWEAIRLERGALSGPRGALPAGAMIGGWIGAIVLWLIVGAAFETALEATPGVGWPVPVGSDVVLTYVIGRRVFGSGHPALHLLLLITIANDIAGLVLAGVAYPTSGLRLAWLLVTVLAVVGVWLGFGRAARPGQTERAHRRAFALWPYAVAGVLSWAGVVLAGLPGALGLIPLIPAIPHADRAFGMFAEAEEFLHDPLNRLAHLLIVPIGVILFLFGLTRGGIDASALAPTTGTVLAALWIGKPLGVILGVLLAGRILGQAQGWAQGRAQGLPPGVAMRDLVLIAMISGMGFTVPVLALETALPGGGMAEAARLGLALSMLAGVAALALGRLWPRS